MTITPNGLAFGLQDMQPDEIFADKKFAQEIEISNRAYFPELLPSECSTHTCSTRITEIDKLYRASKEKRLRYYEAVKSHYRDKLPLGGDRWLSGGNHFHIFFERNVEVVSMYNFGQYIAPEMYKFIKAIPLYAKFKKFDDGTKKFFSRRCWGHRERDRIHSDK